jgi:hypothetical protein
MSGTYPTDPEFQAINVVSKHSTLMSETVSGRRQFRSVGGQRWEFTARYNPMTRAEFMPVYAFVTSQQGMLGSFTIVPPVIGSTSGTASGSMLVNGNHAIGDSTISVDGFTGTLKAGDFVKFASHTKVYMVIADRSGAGVMTIEPALVEAVSDNQSVTYNNVPFTMSLLRDTQEYSLSSNEYFTYEIDMSEVL